MARKHKCNWHGCDRLVEGWQWGCSEHFGLLPAGIRDRLRRIQRHWPEYREVSKEAVAWSKTQEGVQTRTPKEKIPEFCKCGSGLKTLKRLPFPECIECHKKRVFETIERTVGS